MNVRETLKRSEAIVGLVHDSRKVLKLPDLARRSKTIRNYLATHPTSKLQIGAGQTTLDGWLSTDIAPRSDAVIFLDATERFPFDDGVFDYVYGEHMIGQFSWEGALFVLRECRRILKPGGTVRMASPDLEVLLGLYGTPSPAGEKYIKWVTDTFLTGVTVYEPAFVINYAFGEWGNRFVYDGNLMQLALREAGFTNIARYAHGESRHPDLQGIECHGRNIANEEIAAFETMVFEGERPA